MKFKEEYKLTNPKKLFARANVLRTEKGLYYIIGLGIKIVVDKIINYLWCYFVYKPFKSLRTFIFRGKKYKYFYHIYNNTWKNERAIEIPIVLDLIKNYRSKKILEVGNVLSHYFPDFSIAYENYDIVDKYEKSPGVINQDIIEFNSKKKYDLIISISTIEHVGWNEKPRDQNKIPKALKNLESLLNKDGKIVITFLLGYNQYLDDLLSNNIIKFTNLYCLKHMIRDNSWKEIDWEIARNTKLGDKLDLLIIGIIKKIL